MELIEDARVHLHLWIRFNIYLSFQTRGSLWSFRYKLFITIVRSSHFNMQPLLEFNSFMIFCYMHFTFIQWHAAYYEYEIKKGHHWLFSSSERHNSCMLFLPIDSWMSLKCTTRKIIVWNLKVYQFSSPTRLVTVSR